MLIACSLVILKLVTMSVAIQKSGAILFIVWCLCYCHTVVSLEDACTIICSSVGMAESNPGKSCADIYLNNNASRGLSAYYYVNTSTGVHRVYCDMELECGGHKRGWMKIADLDISRGDECPDGWAKITTPDSPYFPTKVVCGSPSNLAGCYSTNFTVNGLSYYKMCGKARGYQKSTPDAFAALEGITSIDGPYVDGLSITVGKNRTHVWTYAVGLSEDFFYPKRTENCPCNSIVPGAQPPDFVKEHYYCESGNVGRAEFGPYYTNDTLWDGEDCENDCCDEACLPWFKRQFGAAIQEDVEVRICHDQITGDEDIAIDLLQLFVQ